LERAMYAAGFAWTCVEALPTFLPRAARRRIAATLVSAFRSLIDEFRVLSVVQPQELSPATEAMGVQDGAALMALLVASVEEMLPWPEDHGLDGRAAWAEALPR